MHKTRHFDLQGLFLCKNDVQNSRMIYGYARVSTDGQSVDAQVKQLRGAGAEKILQETASGARADRVQLRRILSQLDKGDVLMVTRLAWLARSTRELERTRNARAVFDEDDYADHMQDEWKDHWRQERASEASVREMFGSLKSDRE